MNYKLPLLIILIAALSTPTLAYDVTDTYTITNTIESLQTTTHYILYVSPHTYSTIYYVTLTNTHYITNYTTTTLTTTIATGSVSEIYTSNVITISLLAHIKTYILKTNTVTYTTTWITHKTTITKTETDTVTITSSNPTTINSTTTKTVYAIKTTTLTVYKSVVITRSRTITNTVITYTMITKYINEDSTTYVFTTANYDTITITTITTKTITYFLISVKTITNMNASIITDVLIVTSAETTKYISTTTTLTTVTITLGYGTIMMMGTIYTVDDKVAYYGYRITIISYYATIGILAITILEQGILLILGKRTPRDFLNTIIFAIMITATAYVLDYVLAAQ